MADKKDVLDPANVSSGDALIALPSSGAHSNGFSLIRRVFDVEGNPSALTQYSDELGRTVGEALLAPTRIYVRPVLKLLQSVAVRSMAHITGGGFYENIPRCLPQGLSAHIQKSALKIPPLFDMIRKEGNIPERDMFNTFNMGVGMCLVVPPDQADEAVRLLRKEGEDAYIMGEVLPGGEGAVVC